jgi:ribosomal protein L44E
MNEAVVVGIYLKKYQQHKVDRVSTVSVASIFWQYVLYAREFFEADGNEPLVVQGKQNGRRLDIAVICLVCKPRYDVGVTVLGGSLYAGNFILVKGVAHKPFRKVIFIAQELYFVLTR